MTYTQEFEKYPSMLLKISISVRMKNVVTHIRKLKPRMEFTAVTGTDDHNSNPFHLNHVISAPPTISLKIFHNQDSMCKKHIH